MQDRFKFRAWAKDSKEMLYDVEKTYDYVFGTCCHDNFGSVLEDDRFIVLQCTGLKDCNNKLIYEGDIIEIANGSINESVIKTSYEVKRKEYRYNIPDWTSDKPDFSHYVKVIGNVYENPELLKKVRL